MLNMSEAKTKNRFENIRSIIAKLIGIEESKVRILKDYKGKLFLFCGSLTHHRKFWIDLVLSSLSIEDFEMIVRKHNGSCGVEDLAPTFESEEDLLNFIEEILIIMAAK